MSEVKLQDCFDFHWERAESVSIETNDGCLSMRGWQEKAFEELHNVPFMILNAPMGSGKSLMMCLLAAHKMRNDSSLRCIIAVPQTIVAPGFLKKVKLLLPGGEKLEWAPEHNLCECGSNRSTSKRIINWLEADHLSHNERVLICTHAALVKAYGRMKEEEQLHLLQRLLVWVDEAHHVKNAGLSGSEERTFGSNGLGEFVSILLKKEKLGVQIGLTTATFFRGDRHNLVTEDLVHRFKRFDLPYDEYLRSMKHLQSFSFSFLMCGQDYTKAFESFVRAKKKDIIYIPHPTSRHATCHKLEGVKQIVDIYTSAHGGEIVDDNEVPFLLAGGAHELKILDLVNERKRDRKKEFLNGSAIENRDALDVIITLGMFKEGANWIFADRCVIVGPRSSLVDSIQMIGRLLRDTEGKTHVEVIQLLPFSLDPYREDYLDNLNNYLKAIFAALILKDILKPIKIKAPLTRRDENPGKENDLTRRSSLRDHIPEEYIGEIMAKASMLWANIGDQAEEILPEGTSRYDLFQKKLLSMLEGYPDIDPTKSKEIGDQLWKAALSKPFMTRGLDVETIDFELLKRLDPLKDGLFQGYFSGVCHAAVTFEDFRKAVQVSYSFLEWRSFEEARSFVRALKLKSETEWRLYIDGKITRLSTLPQDIPRAPWVVYRDLGWISWGDFLGTDIIAPRLREYRAYEGARIFARSLLLKRKDDWFLYVKGSFPELPPLPEDIPATPDKIYRRKKYGEKWNGWGDFLGTSRVSNQEKSERYLSFHQAREFARQLHLNSYDAWKKYLKGEFPHLPSLSSDIPRKPDQVYQDSGWISWQDFLGSSSKYDSTKQFREYEEARKFVHSLGLKSQKEWHGYCAGKRKDLPEKPGDIPTNPQKSYKNQGWRGYPDWLGYGV